MEGHPIPRQITTFEFKLIGFLTVKQFIYLAIFVGLGLAVYGLTPIPYINILLGVIVASFGAALAFIPVNDRPLEVWLRNLLKRLTSPTQYQFQKHNSSPQFLNDLYPANSSQVATHIDSQQKLSAYLSKTPPQSNLNKKQSIHDLLQHSSSDLRGKDTAKEVPNNNPTTPSTQPPQKSFLTGMVKNYKLTPLSGILLYVKKDETGEPMRILKTNINGVFVTYKPLDPGEYFFEVKDPNDIYFFDTMKIKVENTNLNPLEFVSKELI